MKKTLLTNFAIFGLMAATQAQNINIPDGNFKAFLVGNTSINTNSDTEIQVAEAAAYTGTINCAFKQISNLSGIEAFTKITELRCNNNSLKSLDVSKNSALTSLICNDNSIRILNVIHNSNLTTLNCFRNSLSNLYLNTSLTLLNCQLNSLLTLDVTENVNLKELYCQNNLLTRLDLSQNSSLTALFCSNNSLTILDVANGNNSSVYNGSFIATNNPNLTCIQVDDATSTSWTNIDSTANFSNNCAYSCTVIFADTNFKAALLDHGVGITGTGISTIDLNNNGEIECTEAAAYNGKIKCSSKQISNLTGIEKFVNLTSLDCSRNGITSLFVSICLKKCKLNLFELYK